MDKKAFAEKMTEIALELDKIEMFKEADLLDGIMNKVAQSNEMLNQYLVTALWSSNDQENDQGGEPLDNTYNVSDISPESVQKASQDCAAFVQKAGSLLDEIDSGQAGHDFWLTRNGHGAGFWDRGLGEVGQRLSDIAREFGGSDAYVGDDGQVHLT
jgi:hypothetical protein